MPNLIQNAYHKSRFYGWMLQGAVPERFRGAPTDPLPGNADDGRLIMDGDYRVLGTRRHLGDLPWLKSGLSGQGLARLHRFDFLRDLRALGSAAAGAKGRELITRWSNAFGRWHEIGWDPAVTGGRIVNWLCAFPFVNDASHPGFELSVREQLAVQARHLARRIDDAGDDEGAVEAAEGLILAGTCLVGLEHLIDDGLNAMAAAIRRQVLPDGGHIGRNAHTQIDVLARLIRVRDTLTAARIETPGWLDEAVDRMPPLLRTLLHGDGDAALFNGASEGLADDARAVLAAAGNTETAVLNAGDAGFQRLETPNAVAIADAGAGLISESNRDAHAGLLSFEFSRKRQRIIVNCGAHPDREDPWHNALRATAAHTALVVDDTNAVEVLDGGGLRHSVTDVSCRRSDSGGSSYIQMRHNGYRKLFGLIHSRDLYLASTGDDLRGRDSLNPAGDPIGRPAERFTIRFHLHPDVTAEATSGGEAAMLKLPNKEGWRFRCTGGDVTVEDSIYVGEPATPRRARQIVVTGPVSPLGVDIKWSLILERRGR